MPGSLIHPPPAATYRLQLNRDFPFAQAQALTGYLNDLGISDCYLSPILTARPGSMHGYDVTDPGRINPELGGEAQFKRLAAALARLEMGLLVDIVPNHMCISDDSNRWWRDVLEFGRYSSYACFFDIDWEPPDPVLRGKVLLPILGATPGRAVREGGIALACHEGSLRLRVYARHLPLAPHTWERLLAMIHARLQRPGRNTAHALAGLEAVQDAARGVVQMLEHGAPTAPRPSSAVRERLFRAWLAELSAARPAVDNVLACVNGARGADGLASLLNGQLYRLAWWGEGGRTINYRRFFDINDLAGLRVEEPEVFEQTHRIILRLFGQGAITGLRIDHPDGLYDPRGYLARLQNACAAQHREAGGARGRAAYVVVEKILSGEEQLRADWPVSGTTGYEFLNLLNGLFVRQENRRALLSIYRRFAGVRAGPARLLDACKRQVLDNLFPAELNSLAHAFHALAPPGLPPLGADSLRAALRELIASFPVYRTYRVDGRLDAEDRRVLARAFQSARRKKRGSHAQAFTFLEKVLLAPAKPGTRRGRAAVLPTPVLRLQQLTGPVVAKGLEDTLLYRYFPLASINEVGCEPGRFGTPLAGFHRTIQARLASHPHGLSATATHDTKRGEDTRARINVLSEIPRPWWAAVEGWAGLNRRHKTKLRGSPVPDSNEEYLIYQTLVGTWPSGGLKPHDRTDYVQRIQLYMEKALREAKQHSTWLKPNPAYEGAVLRFITRILARGSPFLEAMATFAAPIARAGYCNSLAQTLLKVAAPGVPDFYQGTELWDFSLVDPDNRRPVDFGPRRRLLTKLRRTGRAGRPGFAAKLLEAPEDGRVKLYLTHRALTFRRAQRDLFAGGAYLPLTAVGARSGHVVAFARMAGRRCAVAVAGRFFMELAPAGLPLGARVWGGTALSLPANLAAGRYRDVFTGREVEPGTSGQGAVLPIAALFEELPVALLERIVA